MIISDRSGLDSLFNYLFGNFPKTSILESFFADFAFWVIIFIFFDWLVKWSILNCVKNELIDLGLLNNVEPIVDRDVLEHLEVEGEEAFRFDLHDWEYLLK